MKRASLAAGAAALLLAAAVGSGTVSGAANVKATLHTWYWDAFGEKADELRGGAEAESRESIHSAADLLVKEWQLTLGEQADEAVQLARQGTFETIAEKYELYVKELDESGTEAADTIESRFSEAVQSEKAQADAELEQALDELLTELTQQENPPEPAE